MKVAFVTPWYGANLAGGMEALTRHLVTHLHRAGLPLEVWTTCIRDFHADWATNYHRPGRAVEEGIPVHRFAVKGRDRAAFDRVNWQLMQGLRLSPANEQVYINEMINCPDLYDHIASHSNEYLFVFIPYLFATTYFGAQICPARSAIIPCLHDEGYAHMDLFRQLLPQVHTLIFNVEAELALVERLYGRSDSQVRAVVGVGVETDFVADGNRFRQKYGLAEPFLLYVGRQETGKNVPLLLDYWASYVATTQTEMKLVLIGPGQVTIPEAVAGQVVNLGFVPRQDKYDAYAAAELFCQPSVNESFSLVIMESWLTQTPVLVHGHCVVTREHCVRSQGGLYFTNADEFGAVIDYLRDHPNTAQQMGRNGRSYVLANYQWPHIVAQYRQLLANMGV
jgi:glycosyltransferase involved in cell wall biosynthesis